MALIGKDLPKVKSILDTGELVAIPTETVYGLAANALDPIAVAKIFEVKKRPHFDPLIIHTYSIDRIADFVTSFPPVLKQLAEKFLPGPLTLLLPKKDTIPDLVTSGLKRVAVRIPDHPLTLELLAKLDYPLAAPSANPFGYISPTKAEHVNKQLGDQIEYILDGGACKVGLESTIIGLENDKPVIYRLGGLAIEEIEKITGKISLEINQSSDPKAPGQLKSHYAPRKPVYLGSIRELLKQFTHKKIGVLGFGPLSTIQSDIVLKNLSDSGNMREAAANLFSYLRELDESDIDIIVAELVPPDGLGIALNDRLLRAAAGD